MFVQKGVITIADFRRDQLLESFLGERVLSHELRKDEDAKIPVEVNTDVENLKPALRKPNALKDKGFAKVGRLHGFPVMQWKSSDADASRSLLKLIDALERMMYKTSPLTTTWQIG